jgi:nucleoside-diphosphate-sugar epimerase
MAKTRILLTGANSLTGSHILSQLLSQGSFSVRAVVDSREAAYALQQLYPQTAPGSLDLAIVHAQDASVPRIFEPALSDHSWPFELVIHALSHTYSGEADCLAKVINLETEAVSNFLKSVKRVGCAVRRVVIVTSLTHFARWLIYDGQANWSVPRHVISYANSVIPNPEDILATSQASDNVVYDAVSRWTREARVTFDVAYLAAPSIYGPTVRSLGASSDISEANRRIWNICCNEAPGKLGVPPHGIVQFLDSRVSCVFGP